MKTSSILAVLTAATFQEFFQEYFFDAWDFALFLVIMVIVDTITGIWAAYQRGILSSSPMGKVFTKLILYALVLIVLHGLESFPKDDMTKTIFFVYYERRIRRIDRARSVKRYRKHRKN